MPERSAGGEVWWEEEGVACNGAPGGSNGKTVRNMHRSAARQVLPCEICRLGKLHHTENCVTARKRNISGSVIHSSRGGRAAGLGQQAVAGRISLSLGRLTSSAFRPAVVFGFSAGRLFRLRDGMFIVSNRTIWQTTAKLSGFCRYHFLQNRNSLRFFTSSGCNNIRFSGM